jgi:hypothetical protein
MRRQQIDSKPEKDGDSGFIGIALGFSENTSNNLQMGF